MNYLYTDVVVTETTAHKSLTQIKIKHSNLKSWDLGVKRSHKMTNDCWWELRITRLVYQYNYNINKNCRNINNKCIIPCLIIKWWIVMSILLLVMDFYMDVYFLVSLQLSSSQILHYRKLITLYLPSTWCYMYSSLNLWPNLQFQKFI